MTAVDVDFGVTSLAPQCNDWECSRIFIVFRMSHAGSSTTDGIECRTIKTKIRDS